MLQGRAGIRGQGRLVSDDAVAQVGDVRGGDDPGPGEADRLGEPVEQACGWSEQSESRLLSHGSRQGTLHHMVVED